MGRVGITINSTGLDEMIEALQKVGKPSFEVTSGLEAVLADVFAVTQARVHVISGRLKASGHTESDFDGQVWSGSVNYGGPSGTPAYYAIYEQARGGTRPDGTPHDWFTGLESFDSAFEAALDKHFEVLKK